MRKAVVVLLVFSAHGKIYSQVDTVGPLPAVAVVVPDTSLTVTSDSVVALTYVTYADTGVASWYGPNWKGRMTASGETFDPDSMTAAHKWLPFGTIVKVTNLSNDSVIYVRITDRLPKSSTRSIDLTPAAAKRLGFYSKGLQKVRMESVGRTPVRKKKKTTVGAK
ncbi:MAG TPA: septal ring lytic transglycosylase RlpA family protein [Bacteroidia bacterium]|nr:septal ring lytic transglycosylase RlpA family protein [Bacteroidia bacterium]